MKFGCTIDTVEDEAAVACPLVSGGLTGPLPGATTLCTLTGKACPDSVARASPVPYGSARGERGRFALGSCGLASCAHISTSGWLGFPPDQPCLAAPNWPKLTCNSGSRYSFTGRRGLELRMRTPRWSTDKNGPAAAPGLHALGSPPGMANGGTVGAFTRGGGGTRGGFKEVSLAWAA
jgi:hypothetical protein